MFEGMTFSKDGEKDTAKYPTEQIESSGSNYHPNGNTSKEAEYLLNLICSCAYEILYWKHVYTTRNKERNRGMEGFSGSVEETRK